MRYRKLSATGDYTFGQSQLDLYINNVEAVAQHVLTRLLLLQGEWFLDKQEGTPYSTQVLGMGTQATYDIAIRTVILETQGVIQITAYTSTLNRDTRALSINATIDTIYGQEFIETVLPPSPF